MLTMEIQCTQCGGTGLYRGMGEGKGAAVVCTSCRGTGKIEYCYEKFTGKKVLEGVDRVYQSGFGYAIGVDDIVTGEGKLIRFSKFGCTYQEWLNGVTPRHIEDLQCPYMCDNNGAGKEPLERCKECCPRWGGRICDCSFFSKKHMCWEEYNKERGVAPC